MHVPNNHCNCILPPFQELNDRDRFLQVLLEKYQQASAAQAGAEQQLQPLGPAAGATAGGGSKAAQAAGLPVNAVNSGPPLLLDEAVAVIIRNERGRQVRFVGGVDVQHTSAQSWTGCSCSSCRKHMRSSGCESPHASGSSKDLLLSNKRILPCL